MCTLRNSAVKNRHGEAIDGEAIDPDGNLFFVTSKNFGMGKTHPVAWFKATGKGQTFYTLMGHTGQTFQESEFVRLLENVVNWQMK